MVEVEWFDDVALELAACRYERDRMLKIQHPTLVAIVAPHRPSRVNQSDILLILPGWTGVFHEPLII